MLVIETPRSKLVAIAAYVEQLESEFRDSPTSPVLGVIVDEHPELVSGGLGE